MFSFEVERRFRFSASHFLPAHDGACRNLHGHNFEAFVAVDGPLQEDGPQEGMVIEFADLKRVWEVHLEPRLDHAHLNDSIPPRFQPATTENVAAFILDTFIEQGVQARAVRLVETENNIATVRLS